jgi:hypothetical protein
MRAAFTALDAIAYVVLAAVLTLLERALGTAEPAVAGFGIVLILILVKRP